VPLQKRMDLHTARELEAIVIAQAKGEHDLRSGGEWRSDREFRPKGPNSYPYLAPGGRFLLDLDKQSALVYCDLDGPDLCWREVVPPPQTRVLNSTISFEHIVDAPILTLHVAIVIQRRCGDSTSDYNGLLVQEVSVWRVLPELDEEEVTCGLRAERLSGFRHAEEGIEAFRVDPVKLQGDHVVLAQGYFPFHTCSVIKWAEVDGLTGNIPRKVIYHESCRVCFFLFFSWIPRLHSSLLVCSMATSSLTISWWLRATIDSRYGTLTMLRFHSVIKEGMLLRRPPTQSGIGCLTLFLAPLSRVGHPRNVVVTRFSKSSRGE